MGCTAQIPRFLGCPLLGRPIPAAGDDSGRYHTQEFLQPGQGASERRRLYGEPCQHTRTTQLYDRRSDDVTLDEPRDNLLGDPNINDISPS